MLNKKSTGIVSISAVPIPQADGDFSYIVLGLDNGVVLLLNEELLLQGIFCPPRQCAQTPVLQIISPSYQKFTTSHFLAFLYAQRVFAF